MVDDACGPDAVNVKPRQSMGLVIALVDLEIDELVRLVAPRRTERHAARLLAGSSVREDAGIGIIVIA